MDGKDCGVSARFSRALTGKGQVGVLYVTVCRDSGIDCSTFSAEMSFVDFIAN